MRNALLIKIEDDKSYRLVCLASQKQFKLKAQKKKKKIFYISKINETKRLRTTLINEGI